MTAVVVLIPVLDRPHRVAPLLASLAASVRQVPVRPLFLVSPSDAAELAAVDAAGAARIVVGWEPGRGDWARKNEVGFRDTEEEWKLLAADDLRFHPGWADTAVRVGARSRACVVGTNDLHNPRVRAGQHSTHPLVHRDYLACGGVIDAPHKLLNDEYGHWFVDDEFVRTARFRGTFVFARDAAVEHLHPEYDPAVPVDATYLKGRATVREDAALYASRRHLWGGR